MVKSYALYVVVIYLYMVQTKSSYISRAESNFYGTEIEIWAGFGPIGNTEKKFGPILIIFWGQFFHVFRGGNLI